MFASIPKLVLPVALVLLISSCNNNTPTPKTEEQKSAPVQINVPVFNEDSAYHFVDRQVAFGPRTPGSEAQKKCAAWLHQELTQCCDTVYMQETTVTGGDKKQLPCKNIIGVIHPATTHRILFLTHWDSRPWADQDTKDKDKPILAADDGGSGTGILIAVAQAIKAQGKLPADIGIDILFTDVEDYGRSEWGEDSYCLGTQYWAHHPHVAGYKAMYGVLLDMTGAKDARFPMEGMSNKFAGDVQQKVWECAAHAGYSSIFQFVPGADITDDHVPVNRITGIKTIDIINLTPDPENPFAPHWHTHADDMKIIDRATLKAVGQTLLQVIYEESANL